MSEKQLPALSSMIQRQRTFAEQHALGIAFVSKEELQAWEAIARLWEEELQIEAGQSVQLDMFEPVHREATNDNHDHDHPDRF